MAREVRNDRRAIDEPLRQLAESADAPPPAVETE